MNLALLPHGPAGVALAGLLAALVACLAHALVHFLLGRRQGWSAAREIGWAWLAGAVIGAGADAWHLLYLGIVPLESPVSIARVLSRIHDPDSLGMRVSVELIGVSAGVVLGWLLWGRRRPPVA